nr:acyl-CoA dehydrogenase family protein [Actinomadura madurae]
MGRPDRAGVVAGAGAVGRPVGEHEAVARKVAFITATAYAMEAMLDLSGQLADDERNDIRIEAALAKLWSSEMACRAADELVQLRGGRGYETAESLAARGERGVPAEQVLRDLRINRIFEGSSEIMHLLIAREAVDAHLSVAGDIIDPEASPRPEGAGGGEGRRVLRALAPDARHRRRAAPELLRRVRAARQAPAVRRAGVPQAGPVDLLRGRALAGRPGVPAGVPRPDGRHRRRAVRDERGVRPRPRRRVRRRPARRRGPGRGPAPPPRPAPRRCCSPTRSAGRRASAPRSCSTGCGATPTPWT